MRTQDANMKYAETFREANRHLLLPSPVPAYKLTAAAYQFQELHTSPIELDTNP